jgi:hypothetical protein
MSDADLSTVSNWLLLPHVARWWTSTTTPSEVIELYRLRVKGQDRRTHMLMVFESEEDIGWCQWYLWVDARRIFTPGEPLGARDRPSRVSYAPQNFWIVD